MHLATNSAAKWPDYITAAEFDGTTAAPSGRLDDDHTRYSAPNPKLRVSDLKDQKRLTIHTIGLVLQPAMVNKSV